MAFNVSIANLNPKQCQTEPVAGNSKSGSNSNNSGSGSGNSKSMAEFSDESALIDYVLKRKNGL
ncbi:MAG: hypothetical protein WAK17_12020 [Candidatus Nitrosopolaris sp.]